MSLRLILFLVFTLSGFSGLIYESIWTHYLKLFLGHAAYAQTLVLVIFLGGLASGSAISSKYSVSWSGLIKRYAIIEGLIGVLALLFHNTFIFTTDLTFNQILPAFADTPLAIHAIKYALAALLILPQSILLGMTFPLMVGGVLRIYPNDSAKTISILYFTNSFGAVIGVLASSFVLIDFVGLPGTVLTAGILNIILALVVWTAVKDNSIDSAPVKPYILKEKPDATTNYNSIYVISGLLSISFFTGFSSFLYEIGWIRMLTLVMGSSTHSFEIMLAVFILGLASGSLWLSRRPHLLEKPWKTLAFAQIVMGMSALVSIWLYISSYDLMRWFLQSTAHTDSTYPLYLIFCGIIALLIMLPATFCAGMTLPLVTHLTLKTPIGEKGVGAVYTVNTTGAIVAIVLAIHLFMPTIGLKGLIVTGAIVDLILGIIIVWYILNSDSSKRRITIPAMVASLAVFSAIILLSSEWDLKQLSSGVFRFGVINNKSEVLFYEDGKTSTISVKEYAEEGNKRVLLNNGKPDASIVFNTGMGRASDEATQFLSGAIPLIFKPEAKSIAVIGLGSGVTPSASLLSETLEQIDTIEIEKAVVNASNLFRPYVNAVYDDPRSQIHVDDAKTFFSVRQKTYDIIISEPSNPWVSGVATLFSQEFYSRIKNYLNEDGLLVQWMQLYEISPELIATVINALGSQFKDYKIYSINAGDMIIVASPNKKISPLSDVAWKHKKLAEELKKFDINTLDDVNARLIGEKRYLQSFFKQLSGSANSDYFPILDTHSAKTRFTHDNAKSLMRLNSENPFPLMRLIRQDEINANKVTYNQWQLATHEYYHAVNLMNYLLADSPIGTFGNLDGKDEQRWGASALLKHMSNDCPASGIKQLNDRLHVYMAYTIPYLSKKQLQDIVATLEQFSCLQNEQIQPWLTIYKNIINANWQEVYRLSTSLLTEPENISQPRRQYLVAAILYSSLFTDTTNVQTEWKKSAHLIDNPGALLNFLLINFGSY